MKSISFEKESTEDESTLHSVADKIADITLKGLAVRESNVNRVYFAFVLASNSIGVSALAYPSAIAQAGIFPFVFLLVTAILLNYFTGHLLILCANKVNAKSYIDLANIIMGKYKVFIDISFMLLNVGIILSCMLTLNDFMCGLFQKQFFGSSHSLFSQSDNLFWIIVPNVAIVPFLLKNQNKALNILNAISVIAYVFLGFFCFYLFSNKFQKFDSNIINYSQSENPISVFILLVFGYMNQQYLIDTFVGDLNCKKMSTVNHIIKIQYALLTFIYLSISLFGYLTYAD